MITGECRACHNQYELLDEGDISSHMAPDAPMVVCLGSRQQPFGDSETVESDARACINAEAPKRLPVDFRYDSINPAFLKWMAKIGSYAADKYGAWDQYKTARLVGEKSPVNHIYEHLRQFQDGEKYDHFDGDVRWHLVAVAYNAMMEFFYVTRWGWQPHPLDVDSLPPAKESK